ncbi:MAG TPA: flagellar export protein FliJ [Desulfopila sp.]|nr:flagellar export protein FliJ [Desulfopila sp.]
MKPFTLTSVLRYRQQLEDTAAIRLAKAQRELQQKDEEFKQVEEQYSSLLSKLEEDQSLGMTVDTLLRYENHIDWLKQRKNELASQLEAARENVRKKRDIAIDRSRDRQALEKLKEKQDNAWNRYIEKKEAAQLDEIAVLTHERKLDDT